MKKKVWTIIFRIFRCLSYLIEGTCPVMKPNKPLDKEEEQPK